MLRTNFPDLQIYYLQTTMNIHIINTTLAVLNDYLIYSYKECRIQKTKPTLSNDYRKGAWNNNHYNSGNSSFKHKCNEQDILTKGSSMVTW